jgi:hypothetical protein
MLMERDIDAPFQRVAAGEAMPFSHRVHTLARLGMQTCEIRPECPKGSHFPDVNVSEPAFTPELSHEKPGSSRK